MMDILDLGVGVLMGVLASGSVAYGRYKLQQRRKARIASPPISSPTNYDTRIDAITDSGLMRYRLHKAMTDPAARRALRDSPLYERASQSLGWD